MDYKILNNIAASYISGNGIEIGAFGNPISVNANVTYIDRGDENFVKNHAKFRKDEYFKQPDIIDNGETLEKIPDNSQDFIITSHVLEHFKNVLLALHNWNRILKKDGIIYMVVPDKRYVDCDKDKENTTYDHLIDDYSNNVIMQDSQPDYHEHFWENKDIIEIVNNFQQCYDYDLLLSYHRTFDTWSDIVIILKKN